MTKFFGKIGFSITEETSPGVWVEKIRTRDYRGDVTKNYFHREIGDSLNSDININNIISIVADSYVYEHLGAIRFVEWMGSFWNVSSIDVERPRLILTIGGVYNGPEPDSDEEDTTP